MRATGLLLGMAVMALSFQSSAADQQAGDQAGAQQPKLDCSDVPTTLDVHTIPKPPGEPANVSTNTFVITDDRPPGPAPDPTKAEEQLKRESARITACLKAHGLEIKEVTRP